MTRAVKDRKGMTAMSALVVRASNLDDLVKAMYDIQLELSSTGEIAEIANINSVRKTPSKILHNQTMVYLQLANFFALAC